MLLHFYIFSQTIRGPFLWCEPTWFACLFWWLITKTKAWSKSAQSQSPRVLSQSASDKPSVRPLSSYLPCTLAQRMHSPSPLKSTCWGLVTLKFDQAWPRPSLIRPAPGQTECHLIRLQGSHASGRSTLQWACLATLGILTCGRPKHKPLKPIVERSRNANTIRAGKPYIHVQ